MVVKFSPSQEVWVAGYDAAEEGREAEENPHPENDFKSVLWFMGWLEFHEFGNEEDEADEEQE